MNKYREVKREQKRKRRIGEVKTSKQWLDKQFKEY